MTTRPATPLPWRYEPKRDNSASAQQMKDEPIGGSIMSDDMHVARIWSDTDSPTENAAYLCHAANSYPRLVEALRDSSMWLRIALPSLPNTVVEDQNKATGEWLKTRGLRDVVKAVEASNAALLRELEPE